MPRQTPTGEIESHLDELGIDYTQGGSLQNGSFSADEKRAAVGYEPMGEG